MNKKPKVGNSAHAIMRKLYPPDGRRPESVAYVKECERRGLKPMMKV